MPPERLPRDDSALQHGAAEEEKQTLRDPLYDAVSESVEKAFQEVVERERAALAEAKARSISEMLEAATKLKIDAAEEVGEMRRKLQDERAALEEEKAAMEKAHIFQKKKILLNVGGHRFETSLQTLTAVPTTCFDSLFSGRFELIPDAEGGYFIDRDGVHFRHILNFREGRKLFSV
jgi:hypothetical protein